MLAYKFDENIKNQFNRGDRGYVGQKKYGKLILKNLLLWFQRFLPNVKIQLCYKDMANSILCLDFYIGNRRVIFEDFFTIFAYKICNIDVENIKIVKKMQNKTKYTMDPG